MSTAIHSAGSPLPRFDLQYVPICPSTALSPARLLFSADEIVAGFFSARFDCEGVGEAMSVGVTVGGGVELPTHAAVPLSVKLKI
jgi:hypothetical protein